ncbi:hypothetical protein PYCC9005_001557 [Savitreella phatthalungensis]
MSLEDHPRVQAAAPASTPAPAHPHNSANQAARSSPDHDPENGRSMRQRGERTSYASFFKEGNGEDASSNGRGRSSPGASGEESDADPPSIVERAVPSARRSQRRPDSPVAVDDASAPVSASDGATPINPKKRAARMEVPSLAPAKRGREVKRIKISSPHKHRREPSVELGTLPSESKSKSLPQAADDSRMRPRDDDQNSNDEHCYTCQGTGKLLCCDDCPKSFHFNCIDPPIEEADIPDEPFFCMPCFDRRFGFPRPTEGLWQQLMTNELTRDPVVYLPPADIRNFFEGVSTGELGVYSETRDVKSVRKDRHGFAEEIDAFKMRDRNNRAIMCYRCGESAVNSLGIISCDHCTSHWHLDCLVPPLPILPSNLRKWTCPLHSRDITPTTRKPKGGKLRDTVLSRGFANRGDVDIKLSDGSGTWHPSPVHTFEQQAAYAELKAGHPVHDMDASKYRISESGVVLDFLDTVRRERQMTNDAIASRKSRLQAVPNTASSSTSTAIVDALPGAKLEDLVDVACTRLQVDHDTKQERSQLLAIKALLEVKGKDALLGFLQGKSA